MGEWISWSTIASLPFLSIVLEPGSREFLPFLLTNGAIAAAIYWRRSKKPTLRGMVRYCVPLKLLKHPSAIADYKIWVINGLFLILMAPLVSAFYYLVFSGWLSSFQSISGVDGLHRDAGIFMFCCATVVGLLAIDAGLFFSHYAMHKMPVLWEFHKTHHSAQVLTPITVFRTHPVDQLLTVCTIFLFSAPATAALIFVYGTASSATVFGINIMEFAFYVFGYHLRHSHVWLMFPGWLGRHISSPALHLVHHSADRKHWDKNLAQMFTFWDRLFGTLYLPVEKEKITFGIGHGEEFEFRSIGDFYFRSFRQIGSRIAAGRKGRDGQMSPERQD